MWDMDIDYQCGTGHGVVISSTFMKPPTAFAGKHVPERDDGAVLEAGMVTTDEPGVYIEGSHGIRIENELVCRKGGEKCLWTVYVFSDHHLCTH